MNKNSAAKHIAAVGLLTAAAIVIHIAEGVVPPVIPVPGVKPGFANIVTMVTLMLLGKRDAFAVTMLRITLGAVFAGNMASFCYSAAGGLLSFAVMALLAKPMKNYMWAVSVIAGAAHNIGQLAVAAFMLKSAYAFYYLPALVISGIAAGALVGIASSLIAERISKIMTRHF